MLTGLSFWAPYLVGSLLLLAAVLKALDLAQHPVSNASFLSTRWFQLAVIEWELFLGIALLLQPTARAMRLVALAMFFAFAAFSLSRAVLGELDCGCFGGMRIHPAISAGISLAALALLAVWKPAPKPANSRALAVLGTFLICAGPVGAYAGVYEPPRAEASTAGAETATFVLTPELLVGRSFADQLRHVSAPEDLSRGEWILLLHRPDCKICQQAIPHYVSLAEELEAASQSDSSVEAPAMSAAPGMNARVALLGETSASQANSRSSRLVHGTLSGDKEWIFASPLEIVLQDGVVMAARDGQSIQQALAAKLEENLAGAVLSSFGSPFPDYRRAREQVLARSFGCGPLALIAVMESLGIPVDAVRRSELLHHTSDSGLTMAQLNDLVQAQGLHTLAVSITKYDSQGKDCGVTPQGRSQY